jgi:hypothetical protein
MWVVTRTNAINLQFVPTQVERIIAVMSTRVGAATGARTNCEQGQSSGLEWASDRRGGAVRFG